MMFIIRQGRGETNYIMAIFTALNIHMIVIKNKAYKWILIYSDDALRAW